ncbi:MAG: hypothetical protein ACRD4Q_07430 [Candidatus Acidiferrales bacterium]
MRMASRNVASQGPTRMLAPQAKGMEESERSREGVTATLSSPAAQGTVIDTPLRLRFLLRLLLPTAGDLGESEKRLISILSRNVNFG